MKFRMLQLLLSIMMHRLQNIDDPFWYTAFKTSFLKSEIKQITKPKGAQPAHKLNKNLKKVIGFGFNIVGQLQLHGSVVVTYRVFFVTIIDV